MHCRLAQRRDAGAKSDALVQSEDFFPTFLEGLGLDTEPKPLFDGQSLMPAFKGDSLAGKAVFQYFPHDPPVPDWVPPSVSVHQDEWKLIRIFFAGEKAAHRYLLFSLRDDLGEQNNLAATMPDKVKELDSMIDHFLAETSAIVPIPNPAFDPAKYKPELEGLRPATKQGNAKPKATSKPKEKQRTTVK